MASSNADPRPPKQSEQPSWPERVADVLRRIFLPGAQPIPEPVPVLVRIPSPRRYR